ncbi:MAG: hypothetical protein WA118_05495 [Carboxydocellales bacterium]
MLINQKWLQITLLLAGFLILLILGDLGDTNFLGLNIAKSQAMLGQTSDQKEVSKSRQVLLIIADRLSIADFNDKSLPNLYRLANIGAVGLMNTNVMGPRIPDNTYAAIGAGARIQANPVGGEAFNARESYNFEAEAGQVYRRRMGQTPQANEVVHLQLPKILALNVEQKYPNQPGALGMVLHQGGLHTAVLGNADTDLPPRGRQAVALAMDNWGRVDMGLVDQSILKTNPAATWGVSTDYQFLWQAYKSIQHLADFVVIELGDTTRVDEGTYQVLDEVLAAQRRQALQDADAFLGKLLANTDLQRQLLIVLSPTPADLALETKLLMTPVVIAGPGVKAGLLTTATTKRPGIITNIDIAPGILDFFGLPIPGVMLGQTLRLINFSQPAEYLQQLESQVNFTYVSRPTLVQGYVMFQIIAIILSMGTIFLGKPSSHYMKKVLLGLMAVPLSLLLLPVFPQPNLVAAIGIALAITGGIVIFGLWVGRNRDLDAFIAICLTTAIIILGDVLLGSPLSQHSALGYDPMVGARFYGIGNEYMGVLLGAATIGTTALLQRWSGRRKPLLWVIGSFYLVTTYILAAPNLGTNAGGTIAAVAGLGFTYLWLLGKYPSLKTVTILTTTTAVVLGIFVAYDLSRTIECQSHIGRAANLIIQNGPQEIMNIIQRKLDINLKLIVNITIWARVLLVSIIALGILFYRPIGVMHILREKYPSLYIGFVGVVIGSLVALVFNDSGIVAAATMMIYCSAPLLYLTIQESGTK